MICKECGVCCKLFLINLSKEEYNSKEYKTMFHEFVEDFQEAELTGANILKQKEDGSCIYQKENKCSIHNKRPQSCRHFFCDSEKQQYQEMIKEIKKSTQRGRL